MYTYGFEQKKRFDKFVKILKVKGIEFLEDKHPTFMKYEVGILTIGNNQIKMFRELDKITKEIR
jgi:hypothetical protein